MKRKLFTILVMSFLILSVFAGAFNIIPNFIVHAYGSNWLTGWNYRQQLTFTSSVSVPANYQLNITIYAGTGTSSGYSCYEKNHGSFSNFQDVRFTDDTGSNLLSEWEQSYTSGSALIWFKDTDSNWTTGVVFVYYGNSGASNVFDGWSTFLLFDNFQADSSALNTTTWSAQNSYSVSSSGLTLTGNGDTSPLLYRGEVCSEYQTAYNVALITSATPSTSGGNVGYTIDSDGTTNGPDHGCPSNCYLHDDWTQSYEGVYRISGGSYLWLQKPSYSETVGTYYTFELANYNQNVTWWVNNQQIESYTDTGSILSSNYVQLYSREYSGCSTIFQWVIVCNYVDPQPKASSWGAENSIAGAGFTIYAYTNKPYYGPGDTGTVQFWVYNSGTEDLILDKVIIYYPWYNPVGLWGGNVTIAPSASTVIAPGGNWSYTSSFTVPNDGRILSGNNSISIDVVMDKTTASSLIPISLSVPYYYSLQNMDQLLTLLIILVAAIVICTLIIVATMFISARRLQMMPKP